MTILDKGKRSLSNFALFTYVTTPKHSNQMQYKKLPNLFNYVKSFISSF